MSSAKWGTPEYIFLTKRSFTAHTALLESGEHTKVKEVEVATPSVNIPREAADAWAVIELTLFLNHP